MTISSIIYSLLLVNSCSNPKTYLQFIKLQFVDINGQVKNLAVPSEHIDRILNNSTRSNVKSFAKSNLFLGDNIIICIRLCIHSYNAWEYSANDYILLKQ